MEGNKVKIVCISKTGALLNNLSGVNDPVRVARSLKVFSAVGNSFLIFPDQGWSPPAVVNFDLFPDYVVQADEQANVELINQMLADPPYAAITPPAE